MVEIRLYVEGGGDSKLLRSECRKGFREFIEKAAPTKRKPRITASGGRKQAYDDFCTAHSNAKRGETVLLLVDSEAPVDSASPWEHLSARPGDKWLRPNGASDEQCHLMVQCMETWFLADLAALRHFFGQGFHENALPANPSVESIPKNDVLSSLQKATRQCKTKGPYGKGTHSFQLLATIDPTEVTAASLWAQRFVETLNHLGTL